MNSLLTEILVEKRREVKVLKERGVSRYNGHDLPPIRDFEGAVSVPNKINLIAEIKLASPSTGILCETKDPVTIGKIYEKAGAAAISLLTDKRFFKGDLKQLPPLKKAISLPILRKDFILDEIQVRESFLWGADAILLIARILSQQKLGRFLDLSRRLGMAVLTEVHDQNDLNKAVACGAEIIGINNRDLDTLEVSLKTTLELSPQVPKGHIVVSESGLKKREDLGLLRQLGVQAILVGTSLMASEDMGKKTRELAGL